MPRGPGTGFNYRKVPTMTALNEAELPAKLPPETRAALGVKLLEDIRLDSIRAHRRRLEEVSAAVRKGRIAAKDGLAQASIIKMQAELLMVEKIMAAQGQADDAPEHPLGLDGGVTVDTDLQHTAPQITQERRVGVDAKGNAIDETTTTVVGGADMAASVPGLAPPEEDEEPANLPDFLK